MNEIAKRLIEHQIKNNISEKTMCSDIGIARMTYYNMRKGLTKPHESTLEVINKYIDKNVI